MGSPSTSIVCSSTTTTFALRGHLCVPQPRQLATSSRSRGLPPFCLYNLIRPEATGTLCERVLLSEALAPRAKYLEQLGDCQTGEQKDDQYGQQAIDRHDHAASPAIALPQRIIR